MARALLAANRTPDQMVAVSVLLRCIAFALGGQGNEASGVPIGAGIAFAPSEDQQRLRIAGSWFTSPRHARTENRGYTRVGGTGCISRNKKKRVCIT